MDNILVPTLLFLLSLMGSTLATHHIEPILHESSLAAIDGRYAFDYESAFEKKHELRDLTGLTHGSYSFLDPNGMVQHVDYRAGPDGFEAHSNTLPIGVPVPEPEAVIAARKAHEEAFRAAQKSGVREDASHLATIRDHLLAVQAKATPEFVHGGIPDTPEVAAARAEHLATQAAIKAVLPMHPSHLAQPSETIRPVAIHTSPEFRQRAEDVPRNALGETPEVEAARLEHLGVHAQIRGSLPKLGRPSVVPIDAISHIQPIHTSPEFRQRAEDVPRNALGETPEVEAARLEHLEVHAKVRASLPKLAEFTRRPSVVPISNIQPIHTSPEFRQRAEDVPRNALGETPEVEAARLEHLGVHAMIRGSLPKLEELTRRPSVVPIDAFSYIQPIHTSPEFRQRAEDVPRSPLGETPEVEVARLEHLGVHAKIRASLPKLEEFSRKSSVVPAVVNSVDVIGGGFLDDTPEVADAKKRHFAAVRAAMAVH